MPNELKPQLAEQVTCSAKGELAESDVMRALECCSSAITESTNCSTCPMGGKRDCMTILYADALALLREKDAQHKELWEERMRIYRDLQEWKAECKKYQDAWREKDAEIGRLTTLAELGKMRANDYRAMRDKAKNARAEAIEEFAERFLSEIEADLLYEGTFVYRLVKRIAKEMKGEGHEGSDAIDRGGSVLSDREEKKED